jgi:hypothetical protein
MAKDPDRRGGSFERENSGLMSGFLADEDVFDRRTLWRLGCWGAATVAAVILAVYANHSSTASRRQQNSASDLVQQAQQIQWVAKESQNETRRLASSIETLTGDRDRLYSRVTALEQGLDSMTGAIAKQSLSAAPPAAVTSPVQNPEPPADPQSVAPAPVLLPVASATPKAPEKPPAETASIEPPPVAVSSIAVKGSAAPVLAPSPPLVATKSMMAPPDPAAGKLVETETPKAAPAEPVASARATENPIPDSPVAMTSAVAVQRTEFGVDVGGANSVGGLRALWRGLLKSRSNAPLAALRPIIVIRESSNGLGMQLRLVAGPLSDAAAAAKICAGMIENDRPCQTSVFDGQRLVMAADERAAAAADPAGAKPAPARRSGRWRGTPKRVVVEEPKKPEPPSTFSSLFNRR